MAEVDISKIELPDGTICNLKASGGSSSPLSDVSYDTSTAAFKKTYNGSTVAYQYCETLGAVPGSTSPITSGGVSNSIDGLAGSKNRATYSSRTDTNSFASAIRVPLSRPLVSIDNTIYFGSLTVSGTGSIQFGFGSGNSIHFQFESVSAGTYTDRTYETGVWSDGDICDTFFIVAIGGLVSVTFSDLMICPTVDFDSQNPYQPPADTVSSLTENKIDTAGSGLSKSGTTLNHVTTINAKTTSGLFKAKINYTGHIIDWTDVDIESSSASSGSSKLITSGAVYSSLPGAASTSAAGIVKLSTTYSSQITGSTTIAATQSAVYYAYNRGNNAYSYAGSAYSLADDAYDLANYAMSLGEKNRAFITDGTFSNVSRFILIPCDCDAGEDIMFSASSISSTDTVASVCAVMAVLEDGTLYPYNYGSQTFPTVDRNTAVNIEFDCGYLNKKVVAFRLYTSNSYNNSGTTKSLTISNVMITYSKYYYEVSTYAPSHMIGQMGTILQNGDDLSTLRKPGEYCTLTSDVTTSLLHKPSDLATTTIKLEVTITGSGYMQKLYPLGTPSVFYIRTSSKWNVDTWSSWYKYSGTAVST